MILDATTPSLYIKTCCYIETFILKRFYLMMSQLLICVPFTAALIAITPFPFLSFIQNGSYYRCQFNFRFNIPLSLRLGTLAWLA